MKGRWEAADPMSARLAGVALLVALSAVALSASADARSTAPAPVAVTITDSAVTLSRGAVPVGPVVFRVRNTGASAHAFTIAGHRTPLLTSGQTANLAVALPSRRAYPYSALPQSGAAMGGWLYAIERCDHPVASTVNVSIVTGKITLSVPSLRCGTVTFLVTNADTVYRVRHDFSVDLRLQGGGGGMTETRSLAPGQTAKLVVHIPLKGTVYYECNMAEHGGENGEAGYITAR